MIFGITKRSSSLVGTLIFERIRYLRLINPTKLNEPTRFVRLS
jgi:hypothetical protein